MKALNVTALVLTIVGGINWGLVGFFNYNLVDGILGAGSMASAAIYMIVGLASVWALVDLIMKSSKEQ